MKHDPLGTGNGRDRAIRACKLELIESKPVPTVGSPVVIPAEREIPGEPDWLSELVRDYT